MLDSSVSVDQTVEADPRFSGFLYEEFIARHIRGNLTDLVEGLSDVLAEAIGEQRFYSVVNRSPFLKNYAVDDVEARVALQAAYDARDRAAYDFIKDNYEPTDDFWRDDYIDILLDNAPGYWNCNLYLVTSMLGNDLEELGEVVVSLENNSLWFTYETPETSDNLKSIIIESYDGVIPAQPPTLLDDLDDEIIPEHVTSVVAYAGSLEGGEADEVLPYRTPFPSDLEFNVVGEELETFTANEAPAVAIL